MKAIPYRWFENGRPCVPIFVGGTLLWCERKVDEEGAFLEPIEGDPPPAMWILDDRGANLTVSFFTDDGDCPDPTGATPSRRVVVEGVRHEIAHTHVSVVLSLTTRVGRRKSPEELRADLEYWAEFVKGPDIRRTVEMLERRSDPGTHFAEEVRTLDEVAKFLPEEFKAGGDP